MTDTPDVPGFNSEPEQLETTASRYWIPVTVVALGIISIGMLIGTNWIREQLMIQDVALVHAIGEIQTREAISHLWIEEFVTGDEVNLEAAWEAQYRSAYLIDAILNGGTVGQGRMVLRPAQIRPSGSRPPSSRPTSTGFGRSQSDGRRATSAAKTSRSGLRSIPNTTPCST